MTPERWRQIDDLFDAALRLDPAEREDWLRGACGDDDDLRAEVGRLLAQDERADRDGFLTPPEVTGPAPGSDGELATPRRRPAFAGPARPIDRCRGPVGRLHWWLHPQGGDRAGTRGRQPISEPQRSCGRGCASCR